MTVYTPNIPQPNDDPSDSQDQILQNFQTLNTSYGTLGDHYSWDNTNPPETRKHAKVTLPGLPTTNAPGNAIPAPAASNCAIFSQTRNSQTTPFVTRDGLVPVAPLANIWPLMPVKAYASFLTIAQLVGSPNVNIVPDDSFNINNPIVQARPATTTYTFTMTNACRTSVYGVIFSLGFSGLTILTEPFYSITNSSVFVLTIPFTTNPNPVGRVTVMVIES